MKEVLVLCLGNALRRDDGVALRVADALEVVPEPGVAIRRSGRSGLYLLDDMEGFDRVVVVDAVRTGASPPGTVHTVPLEAIHAPEGPSPHAIGLPSAIARARAAGAPAPSVIHVVAIEVLDMETVGEGLTPPVEAAVPSATRAARATARALLPDPAVGDTRGSGHRARPPTRPRVIPSEHLPRGLLVVPTYLPTLRPTQSCVPASRPCVPTQSNCHPTGAGEHD